MNQIDKDFVYNRFPKTEHDIKLYEDYKAFISLKRKLYSLFTKGLKMQMMFSS